MTDLLTIDWDDDAPVATKPKIQLRGPQPGWVDAIEADLKTHTRLLAVAPGGIGKSTVFAFLAARMWARGIRTLVLENRDRLTRQTAKRLADETGLQVEIEMGDEHASPFAPIVVACVQSLGRTNRLTGFADDHFGMVVADECHLSLANQWQRILNYFHYGASSLEEEWSAPPDGTYQPKASVVGFTASPDIGDRKNLGQFYQKRSVDYTYLEAVEDGWLVGIRQTSIPVKIDLKKYKARSTPTGMDFSTNDLSAAMVPIIEELAEQHAKHARDKKSIAFLPSVECARMMTDALIRRGIKSMFVSGECFDGDEKTEDFVRSGPGTTLCNAMIYTYGVDFPDVNCIGWYRATVSKAFYIQGIYRGTRVLPGTIDGLLTAEARREAIARSAKDILTILDPLFVSDRIDLIEPYDLFTDKPEVKKQMKEKGELNPESAREGERDFIKALEKAAKKNAHKAARTIDPVAFALNIGDSALAHYEPQTDREAAPMTVGQREYLQRNRIDISKVTCHGHAQKLIGRHLQRLQLKLATAEQLAFLKQLGFNEADTVKMSIREASAAIDARVKRK